MNKTYNKDLLVSGIFERIRDISNPRYFITIRYNDNVCKNIKYIKDTHKHITNIMNECFNQQLYYHFFIEKDKDILNDNDEFITSGAYHSHFLVSTIQERDISSLYKRIIHNPIGYDIPIFNRVYMDEEERNIDIINQLLRQRCKYIKSGDSAVMVQHINNLQGLVTYVCKTITSNNILENTIDFNNSHF
jgi:hypothetical protein